MLLRQVFFRALVSSDLIRDKPIPSEDPKTLLVNQGIFKRPYCCCQQQIIIKPYL